MHTNSVVAALSDLNPDACFFENMDSALIGVGCAGHKEPIAVYSKAKIYEKLLADGLSQEDADEYFSSKFVGLWCDANTPVILNDLAE